MDKLQKDVLHFYEEMSFKENGELFLCKQEKLPKTGGEILNRIGGLIEV